MDVLGVSAYRSLTPRCTKPILIESDSVFFSVRKKKLKAVLPDINGRSVLRESHSNQSNCKECEATKVTEPHPKRERVRRNGTDKESDRISRLFPIGSNCRLSKVRTLLHSGSGSLRCEPNAQLTEPSSCRVFSGVRTISLPIQLRPLIRG